MSQFVVVVFATAIRTVPILTMISPLNQHFSFVNSFRLYVRTRVMALRIILAFTCRGITVASGTIVFSRIPFELFTSEKLHRGARLSLRITEAEFYSDGHKQIQHLVTIFFFYEHVQGSKKPRKKLSALFLEFTIFITIEIEIFICKIL